MVNALKSTQVPLNPKDKQIVRLIEKIIEKKNFIKLSFILEKMHPTDLYRRLNSSIKLKHFFLHNDAIDNAWTRVLKRYNFPQLALIRLDNQRILTLFHFVLGLGIMLEFFNLPVRDPQKMTLLNKCCELGIYAGLVIRCKININTLKSDCFSPRAKIAEEMLTHDLYVLGQQYWQFGFIQAANFDRQIADALFARYETYTDQNSEQAISVYTKAMQYRCALVRNLISANLLENYVLAEEIFDSLPDAVKFAAEYMGHSKSQWYIDQLGFFKDALGEKYSELESLATTEMSASLSKFKLKLKPKATD